MITFIQDLDCDGNKGKLYQVDNEYKVIHEKENPSMSEKLELLLFALKITARLQGVSEEIQLSASRIY